jgi:hypothetical protein
MYEINMLAKRSFPQDISMTGSNHTSIPLYIYTFNMYELG